MKLLTALVMLTATLCAAADDITLMSFNIKNCNGMDRINDPERTAAAIRSVSPDIVAIQEIDSATTRSDGRDMLANLGRLTGMNHYFGPAIDFQGGRYGIGLLSSDKALSVTVHPLPGREEQRALIVAEYPEFCVGCTHLSLTPADALASADSIAVIARAAGKPFVLMGDFNSLPESETTARFINNGFVIISDPAVPTFPSDSPDRTIDYIMIHRPGAGFSAGKPTVIPDCTTSDHRPIVVTVSGFCGKD